MNPLTIHSWPKAILHMDADAFFASCEQAVDPKLKGRPVVTGKERGIVAAASYEAKSRGIKRGMRTFEVKRICPDAVILPSDYETYSLFSIRMFNILKRFSPDVEEYSIDEAFVDLTGLRQVYHGSYESIAGKIQDTVKKELGITVSIGVSISKVLAKIGSKHRKPGGLVLIPGRDIHFFLNNLSVGDIWGIGPNTTAYLNKLGINTALEYARKDETFIKKHLHKPHLEIWHELNGRSIYPVVSETKNNYQSISKAKTFTPASSDEIFVYAQLSKNLENACIKARRHKLAAIRLIIFLKEQDFRGRGLEIKLNSPTSYPADMFSVLREGFNHIYNKDRLYRQTGVVLAGLIPDNRIQMTLFDDPVRIEKMSKIYCAVDEISERYGKHAIQHASSLPAKLQAQHEGERGDVPRRKTELFNGENTRQRVGLPVLNIRI